MAKTIELICSKCDNSFQKAKKEYTRQHKKNPNRAWYCNLKCSTEATKHKLIPGPKPGAKPGGKSLDQFSPFRHFLNRANQRPYKVNLDLPYLKALWEKQRGQCVLSGREMPLHTNSTAWEKDKGNPWKPSLDRIDSSKGYLKGNVRFICYIANMAKHSWDDSIVIEFCKAVTKR